MPGCVIDIDAHVDSDWGRLRFQDFERSRLCFVLSGLVISDHGSEYCNMAKTAKYVLRCYTCQLLGCVFWVYFVASPLDWGKGGDGFLVWVTQDWAGGLFLFILWVLVLVWVLVWLYPIVL